SSLHAPRSCRTRSPVQTSPLSLHDALPISFGIYKVENVFGAKPKVSQVLTLNKLANWARLVDFWMILQWKRSKTAVTYSTSQTRSEDHTSELQSRFDLVCRLLLATKKTEEA